MKVLTIEDIVKICDGKLLCGNAKLNCSGFSKDTRTIKPGEIYIGIRGENFDGNTFYKDAFDKGASAVILEEEFVNSNILENNHKTIVSVKNSVLALRALGMYIRNTSFAKFIGLTGSVGKTSTRDMVYSVVKESFKAFKTDGNYNNEIGLPLTLTELKEEEVAVLEMGMNHFGEIDYLTTIVKPHIAIITNVGTAHIGILGSRENILKAKLEILNGITEDGTLIINNDNDLLNKFNNENKNVKILTIGIDNISNIMARDIEYNDAFSKFKIAYDNKEYDALCPVPGKAFVYNSLVAFATGILLNMPIEKIIKGIETVELTKRRLEIIDKGEFKIIDDSYNASLDSMKSSLDILSKRSEKRKVAILGDMFELGEYSKNIHSEVGEEVAKCNIDCLISIGKDAKYYQENAIKCGMKKENCHYFESLDEALKNVKSIIKPGDIVLLKASNGMNFSKLAKEL